MKVVCLFLLLQTVSPCLVAYTFMYEPCHVKDFNGLMQTFQPFNPTPPPCIMLWNYSDSFGSIKSILPNSRLILRDSVEQDQPAHTCSLVSLCTLRCSFLVILCQQNLTRYHLSNRNMFLSPITRRQHFRLVQIETNYRRHFKVHLKRKISTI